MPWRLRRNPPCNVPPYLSFWQRRNPMRWNDHTDSKRVLVIDDDQNMLAMYRLILNTAMPSCSFTITDSGFQALAQFEAHPYEVVVTDLGMAPMSGDAVFNNIRQLCRMHAVPMPRFVFCSGVAAAFASIAGADEYPDVSLLLKPFDIMQLAALINR